MTFECVKFTSQKLKESKICFESNDVLVEEFKKILEESKTYCTN